MADIDRLLHDADRKVMGAGFARVMNDLETAGELDREAVELYQAALTADPSMKDPAWKWADNRDDDWLRKNGFHLIAGFAA